MSKAPNKYRILILGGSGFLGNALYKELCPYFKTFATYRTAKKEFASNKQFVQYDHQEDDIYEILELVRPNIVISALRGDFNAQTIAHQHLAEYAREKGTKIIFLSSANTFDGYSKFPSYELDKTLSHSIYGHFKIKIENMLMRLPKKQIAVIRLPMVFGKNCPRIQDIKHCIEERSAIEVFPNLVMNVSIDNKLTQQIHYIINRNKTGIFHLGSTDLVHHDDYIKELTEVITNEKVHFKQVYTTNEERYLAVLPKYNKLPKHLQLTSQTVLEEFAKV